MLDRILITAAHGTGKTTLVNALYARLSTAEGGGGGTKWTLVEEIARRLMAQDGWTEEDIAKPEWQQALISEPLRVEDETSRPYLADRCILDPITYTLLHHPSTDDHIRLLRSPDVLSLLQFYRQPEKTLIIHLLPVEEYAIPDPGVRPAYASLAEFEKTSEAFAAVLKESGVKWKSIGRETRDLEARVDKVVSWVEERMV